MCGLLCIVLYCVVSAVELASKDVQRDLEAIQTRLSEFLAAEDKAMKERIRYDSAAALLRQFLVVVMMRPSGGAYMWGGR